MLKKSLFVVSCLVMFGVFGSFSTADAEEQVYNITRSTPSIKEAVIQPGSYLEIRVGGFSSDMFASKYVIKVEVESDDNEPFVITRDANYGTGHLSNAFAYHSKNATLHFSNIINKLPTNNRRTTEVFVVTNFSAIPLKYKFGVSSGIHNKLNECVDYSDIDFKL